ncbi:C4-dicarboxylate ABC transporter permease [Salipiger aestuarii]|uniref:TRAP transporter small permease protein n=1 Tax=Salipiger aestuarii TaxID=568098 RepID=A0A327Y619_9RHOB|nr:TRAP transporter small permease [Salipiger aestuarii]EIE48715.1 TRAP dicarboxylate transporter, DctQ subunit [Citreicella sp. 357]KAA8606652.1 C4-dicarboxylate ABC transporter permease [Salipiger aestuarii]KAA8610565.1 C4-dicarboxylate ABC transporter permease [Salipiger aestuarii]KAB2541314.1 C4-dicarboxylate ABC transporter permease [Salipiger aestuarii]RAK13909.1 TRAP-type mannitol/chloroaromatic compound transport system permease small subunit [Salipiger aestuarii]
MAGSSAVLADASTLSRLDRGLEHIEKAMAFVSGLGAFGLMFLAVVSVGGREFFNEPLRGYVDWIEMAMPLIAIFGISYVQRSGGHIRMDIVVGNLRGRALWAAELVTTFAILVLMVALVWGSWAHFQRSFDPGAPLWSRDSTIDLGLPLWPAKLIVPVAFSVMSLRCVLQLWGYGRAFVLGLDRPVAVPLVQTVAEQAAAEAAHIQGHDE